MTIPTQPTPEEVQLFRKRTIEQADRSYLNDRLNVELPEGLYGEWIGTDDFSQYNAQMKGFIDGAEYLKSTNKLHETAVGAVIGDVKFMVIPKWKMDIHNEASLRESARRSGIKSTSIEDDYKSQAVSIDLGVIAEEKSTSRKITGTELEQTLKR